MTPREIALSICEPWFNGDPCEGCECHKVCTKLVERIEDAMQRLTGVQQEMEQLVTPCHDLEQARAVAISNLLTHFGIASANSDVNVDYLHKQLNDFLMASIGCNKGGGKLPLPLEIEECGYPNCLSTNGCEKQCPAFPRIPDADTGKTSDHIPDAGKMVAIIKQSLRVEPVRWMVDDVVFKNPHTAILTAGALNRTVEPLYAAPPKREPLTDAEIEPLIYENTKINPNVADDKELLGYIVNAVRAIERAHGIGSEE